MRQTSSNRRVESIHGQVFKGPAKERKSRLNPTRLAADGEPGVVCEDCGARVKQGPETNRKYPYPVTHSPGGYSTLHDDMPPCPSSGAKNAKYKPREKWWK